MQDIISHDGQHNLWDMDAFLQSREARDHLTFITCGSVDDGKSTLLGRLLYDSKRILDDQLEAGMAESKKYGTQGEAIDLALLVDGLQAEREQGITIDVAYRYFETSSRNYIAADTPGHVEYTRNMATGASHADLAIILVDASKGILDQTRRHSLITSMMGVKHVVLAVNKMDLVDYDQSRFNDIAREYQAFAEKLGFESICPMPLSALEGCNVFSKKGERDEDPMAWYDEPCLMDYLDGVTINRAAKEGAAMLLPIQWVNRSSEDFRGFAGNIASGILTKGQDVLSYPSGQTAIVSGIFDGTKWVDHAVQDQAITITLDREIDLSRGDCLVTDDESVTVSDQLEAHILWLSPDAMLPERPYLIQFATAETTAQVTSLKYALDINTLSHIAQSSLAMNEVAVCNIALEKAVPFTAFSDNPSMGSFILIDRMTNATVGAGMVHFGLRRADNVVWHDMKLNKDVRAKANRQKPVILWFTGLSGAGKSTVADLLEQKLFSSGKRTYLLDGDNVRLGLNKDLGFKDEDRVENIRRVGEVAKLMVDAGLVTLVSFISPFRAEREMVRGLVEEGEFLEIFVDTPLSVCEDRDPKGLYKKARAGEIANFTGIDSAYEAPENPDIHLMAGTKTPAQLVDEVLDHLKAKGII